MCRREALGTSTRRVWMSLGAIALVIAGGIAYRTLKARSTSAPIAAIAADRRADTTAGATPAGDTNALPAGAPRKVAMPHAEKPLYWGTANASATSAASVAPPEEAPAQASSPAAAAATVSLNDVHVVVYTTGWCSVCKRAKAWMTSQGIAYEERNIELSSEYAAKMRAINPRGSIPTFDVEGEVVIGFSERGLVASMQDAARRQAQRRQL
jgi:glutaredoxin